MSFGRSLLFRTALAAAAIGFSAGQAMAAEIVMKYHHDLPEDTAQHRGAVKFKELVEEKTGGRIEVQIFANNALGDDVEATQQMQFGAIQGGTIPTAKISNFAKSFQVADLPFLFSSAEVAHAALDSEVGDAMLQSLDSIGLEGGAFWESGFKQFTCNHKVEDPGDFAGRKVRVMESPLLIAQFKALGATPIPIAFSETYTALQQGVVQCQENPVVSIAKMKFYEVQDFVILSNHGYLGTVLVFSKIWFDGLAPELQGTLVEAGREAAQFQREQSAREYEQYLGEIKEAGTTEVIELTPEQRAAFADAVQPVYEQFAEEIGLDLLEDMRATVDALK